MLKTIVESLLFISNKPLTAKSIVNFLKKQGQDATIKQVEDIIEELKQKFNNENSGIHIVQSGNEFQMVTNPASAELIKKFLKDDTTGELTPASLETLTVIAYRGPITKAELEQIRGVNCSLILRNLMIRGLIDSEEDQLKQTVLYRATVEFLKYLGINNVSELPDYEKLHQVENLEQFLEQNNANIQMNTNNTNIRQNN